MLTINNTLDGYLKDVEIKGNTIQDTSNLADIKSVGDKVEGQELYEIPVLSCGKNLFSQEFIDALCTLENWVGSDAYRLNYKAYEILNLKKNTNYRCTLPKLTIPAKFYPILTFHSTSESKDVCSIIPPGWANNSSDVEMNIDAKVIGGTISDTTDCIRGYVSSWNEDNMGKLRRVLEQNIQLEKGTVATPYEPYVEDKLTILSPTPLEKVGDVADRIIEKDGVWGVEKNVGNIILNGTETNWTWLNTLTNTARFQLPLNCSNTNDNTKVNTISTVLPSIAPINGYQVDNEGVFCNHDTKNLTIRISILKLNSVNTNGLKTWLQNNPIKVFYQTTEPQFIPLPHDQQVKLRTFANKTNISFLTEIEGTIKAQVPKSLGATVNTHTTQISNLNKELDRVKKLEESTVSTVETESDFTTVEATSNGYFEDVKLEGKTLVNLPYTKVAYFPSGDYATITSDSDIVCYEYKVKPNTIYTIAKFSDTDRGNIAIYSSNAIGTRAIGYHSSVVKNGRYYKLITESDANYMLVYLNSTSLSTDVPILVLEGDHTQNPPSYFEGLKSVGQSATTSEDGADEIVVSSVNENLFDKTQKLVYGYISDNSDEYGQVAERTTDCKTTDFILIKPNTTYTLNNDNSTDETCGFYDATKKCITVVRGNTVTSPSNAKYMRCTIKRSDFEQGFQIVRGTQTTKYTPHQSDKKRLLFYNTETQTWEKPIIREWDSIEKHSDGKYYYHQRSGEVVLNGSENWIISTNHSTDTFIWFYLQEPTLLASSEVICDKFNYSKFKINRDSEYIYTDKDFNILITRSKLSSQGVTGFKQWLQTNNVTVAYQLAEEKVYECTNIDLITYEGETNYIVESGAIVPKSTLKVHNNISNVVSLLQKKVSLLESNMTKYMITQNRMQLASTYSADSVTFKVDYALCSEEVEYNEDLYNLILNNILVGKDNYNYDKMFTMVLDYASWNQISWEQFDILVGLMDMQHNPPIEETPTDDEIVEETPNEIM